MNKSKLLFLGISVAGILFFAGASVASAHNFRAGDSATVAKGEVIDHTLFAAGNTVDIAGEINGDVYCAGQNITVSGTVHGDVICAGQNVRVSGVVDGDVRLAGQTVSLGAQVAHNAAVAAQSFTLEGAGKVVGDISGAGQISTINGVVGRDLAIGGEQVIVNGQVLRHVTSGGEQLILSSNAKVVGNVDYYSHNNASVAQDSQVQGKTTRHDPPKEKPNDADQNFFGFKMYMFVSLLLLSLVLAALFPKVLHQVSHKAIEKPGKTLLIGLLACLVAPIVIFGSMLTVIGIPLGVFFGLSWLLVLLLSGPAAGYYVGRLFIPNNTNPVLVMLVGSTAVLALCLLPVVGGLVLIAATLMGSGMVVREALQRLPKPDYKITK